MWIGRWLLAAAVLMAACGSSDTPADPVSAPTAAAEAAPTTGSDDVAPTPTAPAVESTTVAIVDRAVTYGGVVFTPTVAELSNEDPTSRENGLGLPSTGSYLHLTIEVHNPLSVGTLTLDDRRFFSLSSGSTTTPAPLLSDDITPRSAVGPGVTGTMRVSWEVAQDFDLADATLVVGTPESTQALLPLAGPVPAPEPVRVLPATLDDTVDGATVCGTSRLGASLVQTTRSVDLPADVADTGLPRRAPAGQAFVEFTVAFTVVAVSGADDCTGTIVSTELIALAVDGDPVETGWVDGPADGAGGIGDTVALTVGTLADIGSDVTIRVGRPTADTAAATVTLG